MIIHPDWEWLQEILNNIQDVSWRYENLDRIMESLGFYLSDTQYVIEASSILDICFHDMLGQGRYTELMDLHSQALQVFDGDLSIGFPLNININVNVSNAKSFVNEYFRLKLNFAHVALLLHNIDLTTQQLEHIRYLYPKANRIDQLDTCCLFLKYHTYGYEIDLDFDLVLTTQQLANKLPSKLRLKGANAIAGYHYFKGNIPAMKHVLQKTNRLISKTMPDLSEIIAITAEQNLYLAVMHRELKEFDEAFKKLDIASERYAKLNNHVQNMFVLFETAMLYKNLEQYDKALQWINLAFTEFELLREKHHYYRVMLDHGKGGILLDTKKYNEALPLLQGVLFAWEEQNHEYHIALANNDVGATMNGLKRPIEAIEYLEKAKELCDPMKDRGYVQELLKQIDINIADAKSGL